MTKSRGCTIAAILTILIVVFMSGVGWGASTGLVKPNCTVRRSPDGGRVIACDLGDKPEPSCAERWKAYDEAPDSTLLYVAPNCRRPARHLEINPKAEKVCRWEWIKLPHMATPNEGWEPFAVTKGYRFEGSTKSRVDGIPNHKIHFVWLKRRVC